MKKQKGDHLTQKKSPFIFIKGDFLQLLSSV